VYVDSTLIQTAAAVDHRQVAAPRGSHRTRSSRARPTRRRRLSIGRSSAGISLYKAHLAVAGRRGQLITAAIATTGAKADEHLLAEVLWQHRRLSGLKLREVVADAKYGTSFNFLYLGRLGLSAFIPLTRFVNMRKDIWGREHFQWLPEEDAYLCPAGQRLRRRNQAKGTQRVLYQAPRGSCAVCPFQLQCSPSGRERSIGRSWGQESVERTEELLASPLGKQRLVERKIYAEGAFGLAKELHGLRRTRFKGRRRVQIQLWLTAAAMNIKRAARRLELKGRPLAPAQVLASLFAALLLATNRSLRLPNPA
jgi:hypothetical protein